MSLQDTKQAIKHQLTSIYEPLELNSIVNMLIEEVTGWDALHQNIHKNDAIEEEQAIHIQDMGKVQLLRQGNKVKDSDESKKRAIQHIHKGIRNKKTAIHVLCRESAHGSGQPGRGRQFNPAHGQRIVTGKQIGRAHV